METNNKYYHFFGYIIKKNNYGEGHSIITLMDRDMGVIDVSAFGTGKEKSKKRDAIIVLNLVSGVAYRKDVESFLSVKEIKLERDYNLIKSDIGKISYTFLVFEVIDILKHNENNNEVFNNVFELLNLMETEDNYIKYVIYTIFNILKIEGLLPDYSDNYNNNVTEMANSTDYNYKLGNGSIRFLKDLANMDDVKMLKNITLSISVIANLLIYIKEIIKFHYGKVLNSFLLIDGLSGKGEMDG